MVNPFAFPQLGRHRQDDPFVASPSDFRAKLFDAQAFADTLTHLPLTLIRTRSSQGRTYFDVQNGHNQAVTVTLIGNFSRDPGSSQSIGGASSIPANSRQSIATNIWAPWIGVSISYATAPTGAGTLTIEGMTEPPGD